MTIKLPETIETERLHLEVPIRPTFELAKEIFSAVNASRQNIGRWLPWVATTTLPEHTFLYLTDWCQKHYESGEGYAYIIRNRLSNKVLGICDLMKIKEPAKSGEFGYWLSDDATGKGYMIEAVKAVEKAAFSNGINRLIIRNDTRNTHSVNVAKNCGYKLDGIMRQDRPSASGDMLVDTNIWSKLKFEWENENK